MRILCCGSMHNVLETDQHLQEDVQIQAIIELKRFLKAVCVWEGGGGVRSRAFSP
jgi:hypothetical protein